VTESETALVEIAKEIRVCKKCVLSLSRKNAVPGEGPADAEIIFIGEGPGFYENEQGRPFVGQAGKYLDELLLNIGLNRSTVYITNVVKCRPPGNRDPQEEELTACHNYLERQINVIKPRVIVTLGRFSMALYFQDAKISLLHGKGMWVKAQMVVPMYHPAAGLHQPSLKAAIEKDFAKLPEFIEKARITQISHVESNESVVANEEKSDPTQMKLF
jgi:uracil-DNA glycosylase family 4